MRESTRGWLGFVVVVVVVVVLVQVLAVFYMGLQPWAVPPQSMAFTHLTFMQFVYLKSQNWMHTQTLLKAGVRYTARCTRDTLEETKNHAERHNDKKNQY